MSGREVQGGVFHLRCRSREWTRRLSFDMTEGSVPRYPLGNSLVTKKIE